MRTKSGSLVLTCTVTPPIAIAAVLYSVAVNIPVPLIFHRHLSAITVTKIFPLPLGEVGARSAPGEGSSLVECFRPPRKPQKHTAREIRPPQNPRRHPPRPCKLQANGPAVPANRNHPPQHLLFMDGRVVLPQGIPPRDQLPSPAPHNAMRHKASGRGRPVGPGEGIFTGLPLVQHNLPALELRKTLPANRKKVSRPHRGQHAIS